MTTCSFLDFVNRREIDVERLCDRFERVQDDFEELLWVDCASMLLQLRGGPEELDTMVQGISERNLDRRPIMDFLVGKGGTAAASRDLAANVDFGSLDFLGGPEALVADVTAKVRNLRRAAERLREVRTEVFAAGVVSRLRANVRPPFAPLAQLVAEFPTYGPARIELARAWRLWAMSHTDASADSLAESFRLYPNDPQVAVWVARSECRAGLRAEALASLRAVQESYPYHSAVRELHADIRGGCP